MKAAGGHRAMAWGWSVPLLLVLYSFCAHAAGDGLLGTYYDQNGQAGQYFTGGTVVRVDPTVNFNWRTGSPAPGIGRDNFSVRWTGEVVAPTSGSYTFYTTSDDGVRLWVNGQLVIDNWTDHSATTDTSPPISLVAGVHYAIRMEYYEHRGFAEAVLRWSGPGIAQQVIPQSQLYSADTTPPAVTGLSIPCGVTDQIVLSFSEPLDPASATNAANYVLSNGATVSSAALGPDQSTVTLATSNLTVGQAYTLTLNNIADQASPPNTIAANTQLGFTVPDSTETSGGLLGTYYSQNGMQRQYFTGATVTRIDPTVDFNWGAGSPVTGIGTDDFSVRWTGEVEAPATGTYTFYTTTDDGVRLYVNGTLVIDKWIDQSATEWASTPVSLVAGQRYTIRMDYYERAGDAVAQLRWSGPATPKQIIPSARLYHCSALTPLLYYAMEEASWSGNAGEVKDSSGAGYNGTAYNGAQTADVTPALPGSPGTCRYGTFNGKGGNAGSYIAIPGFPDLTTDFTITGWINTNRRNSAGQRIFEDDENNTGGYGLSLGDGGSGTLRFYSRAVSPSALDTAAVVQNDTWYFVAAVADITNHTRTIYVYDTGGNLLTTASDTFTGSWGTDTGLATVGGESNNAQPNSERSNRFDGELDEVRVYDGALTQSEIDTIRARTHPCGVELDHFAIADSGSGVTCQAEPVTIAAHRADHSVYTGYTGTVSLSTSTAHGDWSLISGAGTLSPGPANSGQASYAFAAADNGQAVLALKDTTAETVDINVDDSGITEHSGSALPSEDPPITFATAGFRFLADGVAASIGTQIADKPSNTAPGAQSLQLQAIRTNDQTGACQAALTGPQTVDLAFDCEDPASCSGLPLTLNGTAVAGNPSGSVTSYTPVSLDFTSGLAPLVLNYADAGLTRLFARYNIPLGDGTPSGNYMSGSSNAFVTRPFGFAIDFGNDRRNNGTGGISYAADENGSVFARAGQSFPTTVTAVGWQAADDANADGVPDAGADLYDNPVTVSFGRESTPATVNLAQTLVLPPASAGGSAGQLSGGTGVGGFSNGTASASLSWSEVGIIDLTASTADYLGSGAGVTGSVDNVGRFAADHFALIVDQSPVLGAACGSFTYVDQPFNYSTPPKITAKAMALGGTVPLHNYHDFSASGGGDWWKLNLTPGAGGVLDAYTHNGTLPAGIVLDSGASGYLPNSGSGSNGVVQFTLSGPFAYDDNRTNTNVTPSAPFAGSLRLDFSVTDSDGATGSQTIDPVAFPSPEQRWGRAVLENAYGSELLPLTLPLRTEYFADGGFLTNAADSCTTYAATGLAFSNLQGLSSDPSASGAGTLVSGRNDPSAPMLLNSGGQLGSVTATLTVPRWLQYDWDNDGKFDNNPSARLSFGLYSGPKDFIYSREIWP